MEHEILALTDILTIPAYQAIERDIPDMQRLGYISVAAMISPSDRDYFTVRWQVAGLRQMADCTPALLIRKILNRGGDGVAVPVEST